MDRRDFLKICGSVLALGGLTGCSKGGVSGNMSQAYRQKLYNGDILSGGSFPDSEHKLFGKTKRFKPSIDRKFTRNEVRLDNRSNMACLNDSGRIQAYSRTKWHAKSIIPSRMKMMNGVERITVHHEGNPKPNFATTPEEVEKSLLQIQKVHFKTLRAGDIAYHYIIDRAGRIWQGRNIIYQGAHAKHNNSHNVGIMCLGNFEIQSPSGLQVASLELLCRSLMKGYGVSPSKLYGHKELKSTACPGKNLFPYVKKIRATAV